MVLRDNGKFLHTSHPSPIVSFSVLTPLSARVSLSLSNKHYSSFIIFLRSFLCPYLLESISLCLQQALSSCTSESTHIFLLKNCSARLSQPARGLRNPGLGDLKYRVQYISALGFQIPLPYLLEDLRSAAARAQENLSRDLSVSLQKVWARELRRKCETEDGVKTEGKRFLGGSGRL